MSTAAMMPKRGTVDKTKSRWSRPDILIALADTVL